MKKNGIRSRTVTSAAALAAVLALVFCLGGCRSGGRGNGDGEKSNPIYVISREDGSGTRSAFVELMGIKVDGVDHTTLLAEVSQSTAVVMGTVAGNEHAISYVSMGVVNDTVKAVRIDGIEPAAERVKDGTYPVSRPFTVCTGSDDQLTPLVSDFLEYILSEEGQIIIAAEGYIPPADGAKPYEQKKGLSGRILLAGSTSVAPVIQVLADSYRQMYGSVEIEIQQTGSSAGITGVREGACDLGLSSRALTAEEAAGLKETVIALDGIAVIVNHANPADGLTSEEIRGIFTGEITDWRQL